MTPKEFLIATQEAATKQKEFEINCIAETAENIKKDMGKFINYPLHDDLVEEIKYIICAHLEKLQPLIRCSVPKPLVSVNYIHRMLEISFTTDDNSTRDFFSEAGFKVY